MTAPTRQHILVTGAGGFVCRNIIEALLAAGHTVAAVDWTFDPDLKRLWRETWAGRVLLMEMDASQLPNIEADAIVHGAAVTASPEQSGQTPEETLRANIDPMLAMMAYTRRHKVRRAIFISSAAVFRETTPGPLSEITPTSPRGIYAAAKQTLELLVETLREGYQRDVIAVRLSGIYGPGELPRPTRPRVSLIAMLILEALEHGSITVSEPNLVRDWTFAPDVGWAICALLAAPKLTHALYNLASGKAYRALEVAQSIQRFLPQVTLRVDTSAADRKPRSVQRGHLTSARLREEIGFAAWTPLSDGLEKTIAWQRRYLNLPEAAP